MPATSDTQAHTARMALAYKSGHAITTFPPGSREAIRSMARMNVERLKHYTHVAGRAQKRSDAAHRQANPMARNG